MCTLAILQYTFSIITEIYVFFFTCTSDTDLAEISVIFPYSLVFFYRSILFLPPREIKLISNIGNDHLTCRGWGGVGGYGFLLHSEKRFRTTRELEYFYLSHESEYFFFLHQNHNNFFSNIGNQNIFFRKKKYPPPSS